MNEWNEMNNRDENGSGLSAYTQGTLSPAMYNVSIGVHLLVGLVITYFHRIFSGRRCRRNDCG